MIDAHTSRHSRLTFNVPLSSVRAAELIADLGPLDTATVVDLGCGWGELLLRVLEANPSATGVGIDSDPDAIARAQINAEGRGLGNRVTFEVGDAALWSEPVDVVIAIGSSHVWGGVDLMLRAVASSIRPGGLFVVGDGIWSREPSVEAREGLGVAEGEILDMGTLVDRVISAGFRLLSLGEASLDEWDRFESLFGAGREQWLFDNPDAEDFSEVCAAADEHRRGWINGYRGLLGFAYLVVRHQGR